jgi:hypothetical protein
MTALILDVGGASVVRALVAVATGHRTQLVELVDARLAGTRLEAAGVAVSVTLLLSTGHGHTLLSISSRTQSAIDPQSFYVHASSSNGCTP